MSSKENTGMSDKTKPTATVSKLNEDKKAVEVDKPPSAPHFKEAEDGVWEFRIQSHEHLSALFGGGSLEFADCLLTHCGNVSGTGKRHSKDKNYALDIVGAIAPRDAIEAMLATQMAAVHIAMMRHSATMASVELIPQLELQERILNKLARTFAAQMEALRKHRNGGQQKVTVEHVTVNDGGQAIVGHLARGGAIK